MDFIPNWYTINSTPRFIVKGVDADQVEIGDYTKYIVKFQVYNPTNVEGVISVNVKKEAVCSPEVRGEEEDEQPKWNPNRRKIILSNRGNTKRFVFYVTNVRVISD